MSRQVQPASDLGTLRVLALLRIAWCLSWLFMLANRVNLVQQAEMPPSLWHPVSLARSFSQPPSPASMELLATLAVGSTLLLGAGVFTRWMAPLCFAANVLLLSMVNSFGKIGHDSHVYLLFLFVLMFSDWGHTLSLDAAWREWTKQALPQRSSGWAEWPIWLCTFILALLYVNSGLHKIGKGYFLAPGSFQAFLEYRRVLWRDEAQDIPAWAIGLLESVLRHPRLVAAMAWLAAAFEAGFFVSLFTKRLRLFMLASVWAFHGSIGVLTGVYFVSPLVASAMLFFATAFLLLRDRSRLAARLFPRTILATTTPRGLARVPVWLRVMAPLAAGLIVLLLLAGSDVPRLGIDSPAMLRAALLKPVRLSNPEGYLAIAILGGTTAAAIAGLMALHGVKVLRSSPRVNVYMWPGRFKENSTVETCVCSGPIDTSTRGSTASTAIQLNSSNICHFS